MGYCILTLRKLKDFDSLDQCFNYNYRKIDVSHADKTLMSQNEELVRITDQPGNPETYADAFRSKIAALPYYKNRKVMRNAVYAIELILTFSPDALSDINLDQWKKDNVDWLKKTFNISSSQYGDNLISVMFHADESGAPHCHAVIIPIDEKGHLNAHCFTNGRKSMIEMQSSYAAAMKKHGLERGVRGSSAKHHDVKKFYGKLNRKLEVPEVLLGESASEYRERITEFIQRERAAGLRELMSKETRMLQSVGKTKNYYRSIAYKNGVDDYDQLAQIDENDMLQEIHNATLGMEE